MGNGRFNVAVSFDERRGYVGTHPELRSPVTALSLGGQTCNPYDTKRITGGSSAGSAAAVAANLAICALGTDTAGSVRYPAALNALVGMVATQGLTSRAGIVPLSYSRDRGGPLRRTVADTAAVLEVLCLLKI